MNFVAVCVLFVFLVDVRASIVPVRELDEEWTDFKKTHFKRYDDPEQEELRKKIFAENLKIIKKHNEKYAKGLSSYSMGVNQFADLAGEEFRDQMNCLVMPENIPATTPPTHTDYNDEDLPEEFDWTKKGVVTPVKNQEGCGSCWAFSAVAVMETALALHKNLHVELSEQQLVDCDKSDSACNGGYPPRAFQYVIDNGGIENETVYPYQGMEGICQVKEENYKYKLRNYTMLPAGDEKALQKAVATLGSISVCIHSGTFLQFYNDGVFDEPECPASIDDLNHAVAVVGYGTLNGNQYWKVKNSWGSLWGMDGYVLMSRNKHNQCGIADIPCYPIV